jgi:hypothetical protein
MQDGVPLAVAWSAASKAASGRKIVWFSKFATGMNQSWFTQDADTAGEWQTVKALVEDMIQATLFAKVSNSE